MFEELIDKRYSVRKFSNKKIENEKLDKIIEAGRLAPTAKNLQPIRLIVLNNKEAIDALHLTTECHYGCQSAICVCFNKNECSVRPYDNSPSGEVDASIVMTYMMLQAADLNVGSVWIRHFDPKKFSEVFNLDDSLVPSAVLMLGYPTDDCPISINHTTKKKREEIVIIK